MACRWIILAALCVMPAWAWSAPPPIMPSSQVQRGMTGYGLTVFKGTQIDTFGVEIIGVMRNEIAARTDMIWARISGGPLAETGIISGMSGSPVYIGGRLVGAVAYGISFCKEPLAGITPIENMLKVFDKGLEPKSSSNQRGPCPSPSRHSSLMLERQSVQGIPELAALEGTMIEPLGTPLLLSGFHPLVAEEARRKLGAYGFAVLQGGGGGDVHVEASMLQPGAALSVPLVRGDFNMSGIGTLTYREGNKVLAFGHPLFFEGDTEFPMGGGYIDEVVARVSWSFKLGSAAQPVGVIRQDRIAAIAGLVGQAPDMLPVLAQIGHPQEAPKRYEFEVARHREFSEWFVGWALMSALFAEESPWAEMTVRVKSTIKVAGQSPIQTENIFSGDFALFESWESVLWPLRTLLGSDFERVKLEEITFDLVTEPGVHSAALEGLQVERLELEPGETVTGTAYLRRKYGGRFEQRFSVPIPKDTPDGLLTLRVCDARASRWWDRFRAPGKYEARTTEDLIRILSYEEQNDHLIVELFLPEAGLTVEGRELPVLPGSVMSVLQGGRRTGQTSRVGGSCIGRKEIKTDAVLSGEQMMRLTVRRTGLSSE